MLPARLRMRASAEFRATISTGRRIRRSTLMLYVAEPGDAESTSATGPRIGLIVGRNVGNAVQRNRVKRRLRHGVARLLEDEPTQARIVIRAFPSAAGRSDRVIEDLSSAWHAGLNEKKRIRP
ncbi:ribonuclease P protein component [Microlunatus sp. GCM10028923]|uniref:ribonuclease P protein component n=1 Tax=Microlunatus sp. GCM10028923 TaxID=3273400 RepID=UPI00360A3389